MTPIKQRILNRLIEILDGPMTLDKGILIALAAHGGQEDRGQNTYLRHPLRVMEALDSEDEMIAGVNHDSVEDSKTTINLRLEDLSDLGFTYSQAKVIDAVTKRDGESYEDRIQRVKNSYVGVKIKKLDIKDNLQLWRLKRVTFTEKDVHKHQEYIHALAALGGLQER